MADKDSAAESADDQNQPSRKSKLKPLILIGALMLGEGAGIFAVMKFFAGPPKPTLAGEDQADLEDPFHLSDQAEIDLCEVDAFNRKEGKLHVYHMVLSALVAAEDVDKIKRFVEERSASIRDRIQVVIRAAEPQHLNDPSLQFIKRQITQELNNLLGGKELIREVLVSKLLQSRTNL